MTAPEVCDVCGSVMDVDGTIIEGSGCADCFGFDITLAMEDAAERRAEDCESDENAREGREL